MRLTKVLIAAVAVVFVVSMNARVEGCIIQQKLLMAGQNYEAGTVVVHQDVFVTDAKTTITIRVSNGWTLIDTAVYFGLETDEGVPLESGAPGQFPYQEPTRVGPDFHEYVFDLSDLGLVKGSSIVRIAVHAVVQSPEGREETAWAQKYFGSYSWCKDYAFGSGGGWKSWFRAKIVAGTANGGWVIPPLPLPSPGDQKNGKKK